MPRHPATKPTGNATRRRFLDDETGVTAVEYGLMTALISVTIMVAVSATGQAIKTMLYRQIINALAAMSG